MSRAHTVEGTDGPSRIRTKQRRKICHRLAQLYGNRCFYCTRPFGHKLSRKIERTIDHLMPLSRGGTHHIWNLVLSCSKCNNAKSDRTWFEYFQTDEYHRRLSSGFKEIPEKPPKPKIETIITLEVA